MKTSTILNYYKKLLSNRPEDLINIYLKHVDEKLSNNSIYQKSLLKYKIQDAFSDNYPIFSKSIAGIKVNSNNIKFKNEFVFIDYIIDRLNIYDYKIIYQNILYNIDLLQYEILDDIKPKPIDIIYNLELTIVTTIEFELTALYIIDNNILTNNILYFYYYG